MILHGRLGCRPNQRARSLRHSLRRCVPRCSLGSTPTGFRRSEAMALGLLKTRGTTHRNRADQQPSLPHRNVVIHSHYAAPALAHTRAWARNGKPVDGPLHPGGPLSGVPRGRVGWPGSVDGTIRAGLHNSRVARMARFNTERPITVSMLGIYRCKFFSYARGLTLVVSSLKFHNI